jgi:hypothetical protein
VEAVVLTNHMDEPLAFETRVEPAAAVFDTRFSTCTQPLATGEECALFVAFSPDEVGTFQQRLCVRARETEACVALTGVARASDR